MEHMSPVALGNDIALLLVIAAGALVAAVEWTLWMRGRGL